MSQQQQRPAAQEQDAAASGRRVTFSAAAPAVAPPRPLGAPSAAAMLDEDGEAGPSLDDGPLLDGPPPGPPPGWYARFKAAVASLKHEVLALYYAINDPRTPWAAKLIPWVALAYALSPLDLIPDFIPVLGFLDDMLLLPALLWIAVRLIPPEIMTDARRRAREEPLRLHRNWVVATLIFLMWTAGAMLVAHLAFQRWADDEALPYEWAVLAGTGGACAIAFVTWMVSTLQHEARERDQWSLVLNAPLNPPDSDADGDGLA